MIVKLVRKIQVKNSLGLHTRPATAIVKLLQNCKSEVFFTLKKERVNAKSILSLLMLAARKNARITIEIQGDDADSIMDKLVDAFDNHFGEVRNAVRTRNRP